MEYSAAAEYDQRRHARWLEYERRVAAVRADQNAQVAREGTHLWDPNDDRCLQFPETVVDRQMEAEAAEKAAKQNADFMIWWCAKAVQAPAGPVAQAPAAHEPAPPTGTETDDSNRARRDRILTKAFDHMGRGQIGNNTYTLMDFSNHLDMKTDLWDVRMHLHDMIRRGLVRLVGPGVYAAIPEWQRPPVPQDACEHEDAAHQPATTQGRV